MQQKRKKAAIVIALCVAGVAGLAMVIGAICHYSSNGQSYKAVKQEITEFFHDQGDVFMQPLEPTIDDDVTIRIRVVRGNLKKAVLRFTLDVDYAVPKTEEKDGAVYHDIEMKFETKDRTGYYDYWTGVIPKQISPYSYHFLLENDLEKLYVNGPNSYSDKPFLTTEGDFYVMPGFATPEWSKGALWYSIMPDSFFNGDITNDKYSSSGVLQTPWGQNHSGGNDYLGGDFKGIASKIEHLKQLNVDAVFMNPMWSAVHQAGYGALDLKQIDSAFGNENDLKMLIDSLHEAGIKVMFDGVFTYAHSSGNLYNGQQLFPLGAGIATGDENHEMFLYDANGNLVTDWGMPMLDFSNPRVRAYVYSSPDSVMQYYLDKFDIDGWRLDVGNSLKGSDPENWGTAEQIVKDMRGYVKQYGNDKLLVSEHGDGALLKDYTLDSRWSHWPVSWPLINYIANKKAENVLLNDLTAGVVKIPRSIGHAQYNYTASHDFARTAYTAAGKDSRLLAGNLLLMTYLGAPVIYYGDETGMLGTPAVGVASGEIEGAAPSSFGPMNWDESTWEYRIFNQQKALGQLRKEYAGVYKDGAVVHLLSDIKNNLIAFGRFNESGRTITVTNANEAMATNVRIEARRVGIKNGAVLTDYLSGRTYTVKKGFVTVDVPVGGSVLVEGVSGNARGELWLSQMNGGNGSILSTADGLVLDGDSVFSKTRDRQNFAYKQAWNNCEISNVYVSGSYFTAIRSGLNPGDPFYGVAVKNEAASVFVRRNKNAQAETIKSFLLKENTKWKIMRGNGNVFTVYLYEDNAWIPVPDSNAYILMCEKVCLGVSAFDGKGEIADITVSQLMPQLYESFQDGMGSLFSVMGDTDKAIVENGKLHLQASDGGTYAVSAAPVGDFSVSAKLTEKPKTEGDSFGLAAMTNTKNYVSVRFIRYGGKTLIQTGITIEGQFTPIEKVSYSAQRVTLLLEKYGMMYRAKYIGEDGVVHAFTKGINANYSRIQTGVFAIGTGQCAIDEFSYGDGKSYHAAQTNGYIDLSNRTSSTGIHRLVASDKNKWKTVVGGYETVSVSYAAMSVSYGASLTDGVFGDFKLDATFVPLDLIGDAAYFGVRMGASSHDALDGYTVRINRKGEVLLVKEGRVSTVVKRVKLDAFEMLEQHRLIVHIEGGNLRVYVGNKPLIKLNTTIAYNGGYLSYVSDGALFQLLNRNEVALTEGWVHSVGMFDLKTKGVGEQADNTMVLLPNAQGYVYAGMLNYGITDFVFGTGVSMQSTSFTKRGRFGILVGGSAGGTYLDGGILVGVDSSGKVFAQDKNGILASQTITLDLSGFYFLVVSQGKSISVFIESYHEQDRPVSDEPVLQYESEEVAGGAFNVYAEFANTELQNAHLYGLSLGEDYTRVKPFKTRPVPEPQLPEPNIGEGEMEDGAYSFKSKEDVAQFYKYGGGKWKYNADQGDNGVISGVSYSGNWIMGAAIAAGKTTEAYDLQYSMKIDAATGIAGIHINKFAATSTHEESGIFLYTGNGNELIAYDGTSTGCARGIVTNDNGWISLKVSQRVQEGKHVITVYDSLNSHTVVMSFVIENANRPSAISGYVSLNVGNTAASFKDIKYNKYV